MILRRTCETRPSGLPGCPSTSKGGLCASRVPLPSSRPLWKRPPNGPASLLGPRLKGHKRRHLSASWNTGPAEDFQGERKAREDKGRKLKQRFVNLQAITSGQEIDTILARDLLASIWLGEVDEIRLEGVACGSQIAELQGLVHASGFRMLHHEVPEAAEADGGFTVSRFTIGPEGPITYAAAPGARRDGFSIGGIFLAKSTVLDRVSLVEQINSMNLQPGCGQAVFRVYPEVSKDAVRLQSAAQKRGLNLMFYHKEWAVFAHASEPQPSYRADMDPEVMYLKLPWRLSAKAQQAAVLDFGQGFIDENAIQEHTNPNKWSAGSHNSGDGGSGHDNSTGSLRGALDTSPQVGAAGGGPFTESAAEEASARAEELLLDGQEDDAVPDPWWAAGEELEGGSAAAGQSAAVHAEQDGQLSVRDLGLYRGKAFYRERRPHNPKAVQRSREKLSAYLLTQQRAFQRSSRARSLHKQRSSLPVFEERNRLLKAFQDSQVTIVSGETGSGKSTQCPQFILEEAIRAHKGGDASILVTQPRRVSAISLAKRVAFERGEKLGDVVGYKVRLDAQASPRTRLLFCTSGVALRRLLVDPELQSVSHVVIDEVHERGVNTDFLLVALRDLLPRRPDLKIILMSATINADNFSEYFGGCPHIALKGRLYEVKDRYLPDILSESKWRVHTEKERARGMRLLRNLQLQQEEALKKEIDSKERGRNKDMSTQQSLAAASRPRLPNQTRGALTSTLSSMKTQKVAAVDQYDSYEEYSWHKGYTLVEEDFPGVSKEVFLSMTNWMSQKVDKVDLYLVASTIRHIHATKSLDGSILVILPGWGDISDLMTLLMCGQENWKNLSQQRKEAFEGFMSFAPPPQPKMQTSAPEGGSSMDGTDGAADIHGVVDGMWVVPIHSALKLEDQNLVFQPSPSGARKVVLATNVAETSLTISDIVYVVDTGRHNQRSYDPVNKLAMLQGAWISQASADQRRGRAGRVRPGVCYRLYPKPFLEKHMEPYSTPELQRIPLEELCLQIVALGLGGSNPPVFLSRALSPPNRLAVENAMELLVELGAVQPAGGASWQLTGLGAFLAQLPVEPRMGKMLVMGSLLGCLDPVLSVAAVASVGRSPYEKTMGSLMHSSEGSNAKRRQLAASSGDSASDHLALAASVNIFQQMLTQEGKVMASVWCWDNYIDMRVMQDILNVRIQLAELLADIGLIRPPNLPSSSTDMKYSQHTGGGFEGGYMDDLEASLDESWMMEADHYAMEATEQQKPHQLSEEELDAYWEAFNALWAAYYAGPQGQIFQEFQQRVQDDAGFAGSEEYRAFYEDWCSTQLEACEQATGAAGAVREAMERAAAPNGDQQQQQRQQQQQQQQAKTEDSLVRGPSLRAAIQAASTHAKDTELVKGALVAGMYPQVALVRLLIRSDSSKDGVLQPVRARDRYGALMEPSQARRRKSEVKRKPEQKRPYSYQIRTLQDGIVDTAGDSLVHQAHSAVNSLKLDAPWLPHRWLVFSEKVLTRSIQVSTCTPVTDAAMLLFGGELCLKETDSEPQDEDASIRAEEEGGWVELHGFSGLIKYLMPRAHAEALLSIRAALSQLIQAKINRVYQEMLEMAEGLSFSATAHESDEQVQLVASVSRLLQASNADPYYIQDLEALQGAWAGLKEARESPEEELELMQRLAEDASIPDEMHTAASKGKKSRQRQK